ncbi:polyubiquitin-B isoform X2 [Tachysurus ichikawai]
MENIFVETQLGDVFNIRVMLGGKVEDAKNTISSERGIPREQQILLLGDTVLEDHRTLADYNIQEGSTVRLLVHLRASRPERRTVYHF